MIPFRLTERSKLTGKLEPNEIYSKTRIKIKIRYYKMM